ncbi:MAG: peptide-methionine (S)-S-oxide reductase MsrA [Paraperlucidibaca sp.]
MNDSTIVLGGGCFWCLDAVYREVPGVLECVSGYAGGARPSPSYEQICSGATGHAEIVRLRYDNSIIDLHELLRIFFVIHDPTTLNRQGNDSGTQYRSVVFCQDDAQRDAVTAYIDGIRSAYASPIVTEIANAAPFWPAESYHQDYFRNNPGQGYCQFVVAPKVMKYREMAAT